MIYVTGDIHGHIDIRKLLKNKVTERITERDYVIICGDFGLVYDYKKENRDEKKWLDWLQIQKWTTLFVDGNHECFPRLYNYPVKEWKGGMVHVIRPKVLHLMRGEIFEIEGKTIFAMGGAASHDRGPAVGDTKAVINKFWWPEEIPSDEELAHGLENLKKHDNKVDIIITHCLPSIMQFIVKKGEFKADKLTNYLEQIHRTIDYKYWYCGHYHINYDVTARLSILFSRIIPVGQNVINSEIIPGIPKYRKEETVLVKRDNQECFGTVQEIMPWGKLLNSKEPWYKIVLFGDDDDLDTKLEVVTVPESMIVEKSLVK